MTMAKGHGWIYCIQYGYIIDNAKIWDVVELDSVTIKLMASGHFDLDESEKDERVHCTSC